MSNDVDCQDPKAAPTRADHEFPQRASLWDSFIAAVQFLTRLPIGSSKSVSHDALRRLPIFFPVVGACIGVFTALVIGIGCELWPVWLAVLIALAIELRLTGALHEDGVADFCDAFGGGWTRDEVLAILKDSRIGTYGALGLLVGFSLRTLATIAVVYKSGMANPWSWGLTIVASAMIGRLVMCLAMYWVPPIPRRSSLARDMAEGMTWRDMLAATLMVLPIAVLFIYFQPRTCLAAIVFVIPTIAWILWRVKQRLGGITGDCLGLVCYVAQVLVLLAGAIKSEFWSNFL